MALSKSNASITQLTAAGTSTTVSPTGISPVASLTNYNGSGSVTAAATAQIQYQLGGSTTWHADTAYLVTFGTATGGTDVRTIQLPDAVSAVKITYVAPTGASGYTLDAELGWVTP